MVRDLDPGPGRRLGVLLDHLVDGSKETRAAEPGAPPARARDRHARSSTCGRRCGPRVAGIDAWPDVPRGVPWKAGVLDALGVAAHPGEFWRQLLGRVRTYADLEPALVGAVEQLIDFVTED